MISLFLLTITPFSVDSLLSLLILARQDCHPNVSIKKDSAFVGARFFTSRMCYSIPNRKCQNTESSNKQIPVVSPVTRARFFPQESSSKRRKDELGVVGVSKFSLPSLL